MTRSDFRKLFAKPHHLPAESPQHDLPGSPGFAVRTRRVTHRLRHPFVQMAGQVGGNYAEKRLVMGKSGRQGFAARCLSPPGTSLPRAGRLLRLQGSQPSSRCPDPHRVVVQPEVTLGRVAEKSGDLPGPAPAPPTSQAPEPRSCQLLPTPCSA